MFERRAAEAGLRTALVDDGGETSYRELDERANGLAWRLRELGIGRGSFVGLALPRSRDSVAATLAILKAGAAYVPLDPAYPPDRLRFMVRDARIRVVLTAGGPSFADLDADVVPAEALAAPRRRDVPPDSAHPESVAYVMYTSGTTGRPKGVAVPHRAVVQLVQGQRYVRFGPDEVVLHLAPISFDASTFEIWGALLNGAQLAIASDELPSPRQLGALVRRHAVTTLWLTAAHFQVVVEDGVHELATVRQLLAGGDVLSIRHVARVLEELPDVRLVNGYGPTETTTFACCHSVARAGPGPVPIGRPLAHTVVRVLGDRMGPVAPGAAGEIYIGGAGVAHGYLHRPALTAERFLPDPLGEPGTRLYRTGDHGRFLADGEVEFAGRRDAQVKLRGYRVELAEVEDAVAALDGLQAAVTAVWPDELGAKRLVAYVVPAKGAEVTERSLRRELATRLPAYMIPSTFVLLESLPISPIGKVDRGALSKPRWARAATA